MAAGHLNTTAKLAPASLDWKARIPLVSGTRNSGNFLTAVIHSFSISLLTELKTHFGLLAANIALLRSFSGHSSNWRFFWPAFKAPDWHLKASGCATDQFLMMRP